MSHEVLYDAVLCFQLLKKEVGVMAFDDYSNNEVKKGIDSFLLAFENQIEVIFAGQALLLVKK